MGQSILMDIGHLNGVRFRTRHRVDIGFLNEIRFRARRLAGFCFDRILLCLRHHEILFLRAPATQNRRPEAQVDFPEGSPAIGVRASPCLTRRLQKSRRCCCAFQSLQAACRRYFTLLEGQNPQLLGSTRDGYFAWGCFRKRPAWSSSQPKTRKARAYV